jgi:uncharacterized protein YecA (UPF0149 family)
MPRPGERLSHNSVAGPEHWATTKRARAFQESQWQLSMHVVAQLDGWHLYARVWRATEEGKLQFIEVANAAWRGRPAGAQEVVEWGQRALARWLADNLPVE